MPIIFLRRRQLDALGKTIGLLWQLTLITGVALLPAYTTRVRSVLTDGGVERLIADSVNILPDFFWFIRANPPANTEDHTQLFPRAIKLLGWKHQMDLIIRKGLTSLVWFPVWVSLTTQVVYFLRNVHYLAGLQKKLNELHLAVLCGQLEALKLPNFAKWRWNTLDFVCVSLNTVVQSLSRHFDVTWFADVRDRVMVRSVQRALSSQLWLEQFELVSWYAGVSF